MVATVVLFPLMLLQFGLNVLILRSASSSEIISLSAPQLLVLVLTAALLAAGVWVVMAALLPFVQALTTGEEVTADDALKALPHSLKSMPPKADGAAAPNPLSLFGPLVLGYVVVVALAVVVTGNLLTIGMAFLEMTGLLAVGVLLTPPVAITLLMLRVGLIHSPEPEVAAASVAAPSPDSASTSVAPPGGQAAATPEPATVGAEEPPSPELPTVTPVAGSPSVPPQQPAPPVSPAPPPSAGRGSVPPPS